MKIKDYNAKTFKPMRDLVAFKWLKPEGFSEKSAIIIPDSIHDGGGEGRLGHRYTCEVLSTGPDVHTVKVGDRFLLHEYDKVDTATPWAVDEVLFVEEGVISVLLDKDTKSFIIPAEKITQKMADEYEDY